ncbi:MAG: hypothetical protein IIV04_05425 [Bacteroidaceae bacterium]|nr:hypothetical protein [Bacteroidaceae bacterium]
MSGVLNYSLATVLVVFALFVLMGKADWGVGKYKPAIKERKLVLVKYRKYDPRRARPLFALVLFIMAVFVVLEYLLRPLPLYSAVILLAVVLPIALYIETKCRVK